MRKKITKEGYNKGLILLALLFFNTCIIAQKDYNKVYEKSFSSIKSVEVTHRRGPIEILPSKNGQVSYRVELSFKAKTEADAQMLIEHFELSTNQVGSKLDLSSDLNIKEWNSRNGNVRIRFSDGDRAEDIKEVKVKMQLFVPTLDLLELANKYDDIVIEQPVTAELKINLYSGRLKVAQVNNNLNLSMKYSKALVGDFKNGNINIYDSDIELGNGGQIKLESKYSGIELGNIQSLTANTYDDKMTIKNIQGNLVLDDKYSEFKIESTGNTRLNLYDSEFELNRGKNIQVKSKYTTFRMGIIEDLDFEISYDDEVKVRELNSFSASESKYTDYNFQKLNKSIKLKSHDDDLDVDEVGSGFSGFTFEGKYTDVELNLDSDVKFRVEAYTKYGKLNFPDDRFEANIHKEKGSELELKGAIKGAGSTSPLVKINAHDCKISIM